MTSLLKEVELFGSSNFRVRVALAAITNKSLIIDEIHIDEDDNSPGLKPHEAGILKLYGLLAQDYSIQIDETHTRMSFSPGFLTGSLDKVVFFCPKTRGITYYAEFLMLLSYFMKHPLNIELQGVTNHVDDYSVDVFYANYSAFQKTAKLPIVNVDIVKRAFLPDTDGIVNISHDIVRTIEPITLINQGRVFKFNVNAYTYNISKMFSQRIIDLVSKNLTFLSNNIKTHNELCKNPKKTHAAGYSVVVSGETSRGAVYASDILVDKDTLKSDDSGFKLADEQFETTTANRLTTSFLYEIMCNAGFNSTLQPYAMFLMTFSSDDSSSTIVTSPLSNMAILTLRDIYKFLNVAFKVDLLQNVEKHKLQDDDPLVKEFTKNNMPEETDQDEPQHDQLKHYDEFSKLKEHNLLISCRGIGLPNLSRVTF